MNGSHVETEYFEKETGEERSNITNTPFSVFWTIKVTVKICYWWWSGVNFRNILCQPFAPIFVRQKNYEDKNLTREKLCKALSYETFSRYRLAMTLSKFVADTFFSVKKSRYLIYGLVVTSKIKTNHSDWF